jgi:hypothetical protein
MLSSLPEAMSAIDKTRILDEKLKITFVRHPFVRLVSCYQDKVVDHNYHNWRNLVWKAFLKAKRVRHSGQKPKVKIVAKGGRHKLPNGDLSIPVPSFDLFINFVLSGVQDNDNHLKQYWSHCDVCHINYDVIGKTETSNKDNEYIYAKNNLDDVLDVQVRDHSSSGGSSEDLARDLFAQVKKSHILLLYIKYQKDFEMFGYSIEPFLNLGLE